MNKLIIGLLIVAAGAGAFFLLRKKKNVIVANDIKKEWIVGMWKADTTQKSIDSTFIKYRYDFREDGNILRSLNDSAKADTSRYEWNKNNEIVWSGWTPLEKEKAADSTGLSYSILQLTKDSLQLKGKDSTVVLFLKAKGR